MLRSWVIFVALENILFIIERFWIIMNKQCKRSTNEIQNLKKYAQQFKTRIRSKNISVKQQLINEWRATNWARENGFLFCTVQLRFFKMSIMSFRLIVQKAYFYERNFASGFCQLLLLRLDLKAIWTAIRGSSHSQKTFR